MSLFQNALRALRRLLDKLPKRKMLRNEAADVIDRFIENRTGPWEWDDFCCSNVYSDPLIQNVVDECLEIHDKYPAGKEGGYCNAEGMKRLRELRDLLLANQNDSRQ